MKVKVKFFSRLTVFYTSYKDIKKSAQIALCRLKDYTLAILLLESNLTWSPDTVST